MQLARMKRLRELLIPRAPSVGEVLYVNSRMGYDAALTYVTGMSAMTAMMNPQAYYNVYATARGKT